MANLVEVTEHKNPIIVVTGPVGCGKSYLMKLVENNISSQVNINYLDFYTKILLYILDINPITTEWKWIRRVDIDQRIHHNNFVLNYIKDEILKDYWMKDEHIIYILTNYLRIPHMSSIQEISKLTTFINDNINNLDNKKVIYKMTLLFRDILKIANDLTDKLNTFTLMDILFSPYTIINTEFKERIVYYAYRELEVLFFKEKYNAPIVFIDMEHNVRSQIIMKQQSNYKISTLFNEDHKAEFERIKKMSTYTIKNDLDFENRLAAKMYNILKF